MKKIKKISAMMFFLIFAVNLYSEASAEYVFPDDSEIASMLNVSINEFHRDVKKEMIEDHPSEVRKTGASNPDIGYEKSSRKLVFKNKSSGKVVETDTPFLNYAK